MTFRILIIFFAAAFSMTIMNNAVAKISINDSLLRAQTFLQQGQYFLAIEEVNTALQNKPSVIQESRAFGMKGRLLLLMQDYNEAEEFLLKAFESSKDELRKASYANGLGVLYHEIADQTESEKYFGLALALAGKHPSLVLKIKLNHVRSNPETASLSLYNELINAIATLDSASERVRYFLNLAKTIRSHGEKFYQLAQSALEKANTDILEISDPHLQAETLDSLADLYEAQGQDQQALDLSKQAAISARQVDADDLMLQIEWRKGKIYQRQGRDDYALSAFGKAVDYIQSIRMDIPVAYEDGKSSFREKMGPIYLDYARHLLKKSASQEDEAKQKTLRLARQTIEQVKQTELEDFLGGRCLTEGVKQNKFDNIDPEAAIIYPVIFPEKLELLVEINGTIHQYTVSIIENRIRRAATRIASLLRAPRSKDDTRFKHLSKALYGWIISPIEQDLIAQSIKTLVFVPNGELRLVPFAALFDGNQYLIEKYSLSISPGMNLLGHDSKNNKPRTYRTLLAGLSTPGTVVEKLPKMMIGAMLYPDSNNNDQISRGFVNERPRSIGNIANQVIPKNIGQLLREEGAIQKIQRQLSLPGVDIELKKLNKTIENTTLLNEQFTIDNFRQKLSDESYEIIHIASHGLFSSDADSSFLMAYDDLLKLDDLRGLLKRDHNMRGSLQLLTLSACETAEGDDRAPLGFAGIALKANALSAMGSLWPISDEATSLLMTNFYSNLTQHQGKAESLRQAQLNLLKNPETSHPFFWSPFILVGDWL